MKVPEPERAIESTHAIIERMGQHAEAADVLREAHGSGEREERQRSSGASDPPNFARPPGLTGNAQFLRQCSAGGLVSPSPQVEGAVQTPGY